jgi:hydrogenase nickel incorporation protein HypA/HybF
MHEYALAQNIVDTICDRVTRRLETVTEISVQVGRFSGVVVDSLSFGLQTILSEHKKTDTAIHITEIPSIAECRCGVEYEITDMFQNCPACHSYDRNIKSGTDVVLKSVEVDED